MTRTLILCAFSFLFLFPATAPAKDAPAGIIQLSEKITGALDRIEEKLRHDKRAWREAMEFYFGAVESELAQARLKRREFRHAELALRLRTSWTKEPFRTAVLMRLAEIDLAAADGAHVPGGQLDSLPGHSAERGRHRDRDEHADPYVLARLERDRTERPRRELDVVRPGGAPTPERCKNGDEGRTGCRDARTHEANLLRCHVASDELQSTCADDHQHQL